MTGHIRRRGANSWEIKFDVGTDPLTGRRRTRYATFKGAKRAAEVELAVEPQEVVLGQAEATDGCVGFQATMWSVPIVAMKPVDQFGGALI